MTVGPIDNVVHRRVFRLCPRDLAVLHKIGMAHVASFDYLRKTTLKDCTEKHAKLLLRKLVHHGYLSENRCDCGNIRGWRLNLDSHHVRSFAGKTALSKRSGPHYQTSFHHDQVLNEMRDLFTSSRAVQSWIEERDLRREKMKDSHRLSTREHREKLQAIPDGLMILRRGDRTVKIAFELELTQKSAGRIRRKLENYITDRSFDFAFFVIAGEHLNTLFFSLYREVLRSSRKVDFSTRKNGIYFADLSEIQKSGLKTKFIGIKNSVAIADFQ